jgi:hypothetical protein
MVNNGNIRKAVIIGSKIKNSVRLLLVQIISLDSIIGITFPVAGSDGSCEEISLISAANISSGLIQERYSQMDYAHRRQKA